jgi:uncharacterized protein
MNQQKLSVNFLAGMEIINKNKNIFSILLIIIFVFLCFYLINYPCTWRTCLLKEASPPSEEIQSVKIAGKILKVGLALTQKEQEQGLSGRNNLGEDEGMLFIFDHIDKYPFWMKDMKFPLDIIWISDDYHVVYIKENALPESYPESFSPSLDSKYVLEVNTGFSQKNNLKVGDEVNFSSP